VIAVPVLGAVGIQGLRDEPLEPRLAARWLGAGAFLWLGVPLLAFANPLRFLVLALGLAGGAWALWHLATRDRRWAWAVVASVLALELIASALFSQLAPPGDTVRLNLEAGTHPNLIPQPLPLPTVDAAAFVAPTAFVPRLAETHDRYLTWAPPASSFEKGYLFMQLEPDWPALAMERGTLFGLHDTLGYNPVQLRRYWSYLRVRTPLPVYYNAAVIDVPTLRDVRLLGVRYLVVPTGIAPPVSGAVVDRAGGYDLVEVDGWQPRASVVPNFRVVPSETGSLRTILPPSFDPASLAVLERAPGFAPTPDAAPGQASYREITPEQVRIDVRATAASILVVRTSFDEGWQATVDGSPAEVVPVDGLLQGVAVPAGDHEVSLTYRDDAVTTGVRAGIAGWAALALAGAIAVVVGLRHRRRVSPTTRPGDAAPPR
jgi:Bacterial membrane protein YfhO